MGLYNAAAWLARRDRHLAVNTVLYAALILWEQHHVAHHHGLLADRVKPALGSPRASQEVDKPLAA